VFLNLFTQCSPSPQLPGLWKHPGDYTAIGYRSLAYWTELGQRLERAGFDALFFADTHGVFDVYRNSWASAVRHAVQIPSIDPMMVLPAIAAATHHLGLAVTYSTTYHPPYETARVFSSLDHLTNGRIAWNLVTSYLRSAAENGMGRYLPHNERYASATEYFEVVRSLWEHSWEDGAVIRDAASDVFTQPDKVHEVGHRGQWHTVRGPHQCEPSPQRTPVIYQAGASPAGIDFAARFAEVAFLTMSDPASGARQVAELRLKAANYGREALKVMHGSLVIVGRDRQEARAKADLFARCASAEGEFAKWCGWMGFDLAAYPDDAGISEIRTEASRSVSEMLRRANPDRAWTIADLRYFVSMGWRPHRRNGLYGTPVEVADRMQEWVAEAGVDGFNLLPCPPSAGVDDICDLLVPELQRRGAVRPADDPREPTLRERYFGAGNRHYDSWAPSAASLRETLSN
jgi:FMN-dependent oxidoreductase (nitrilotriacetate monooxygenase family)